MRTRKYMNGKRRRVSPLKQNKEEKSTSGVGATHETVSQAKKALNPKKDIFNRGWSDKKIAEYIDHVNKTKQPGGYHAGEFQEGHKKKGKKFRKNEKTKTISRSLKIPLGGLGGIMLIPKSAGEGSSVINPKTGINKYTGESNTGQEIKNLLTKLKLKGGN